MFELRHHVAETPLQLDIRVAGIPLMVGTSSPRVFRWLVERYAQTHIAAWEAPLAVVARQGMPIPLSDTGRVTRLARGGYRELNGSDEGTLFYHHAPRVVASVLADHCLITGDVEAYDGVVGDFVDLMVTRQLLREGHTLTWAHGVARNGHGIVLAGLPSRGVDVVATRLVDAGYYIIGGNPLLLGSGPLGPHMLGASADLHLTPASIIASRRLSCLLSAGVLARYSRQKSEALERHCARLAITPRLNLSLSSHPVTLMILLRWDSESPDELRVRHASEGEREVMLRPFGETDQPPTLLVVDGAFDPIALCSALDGDSLSPLN
jgi:hypothetical protein